MRTWLFVGSLAAGVLLFVYEWYRERRQEERPYGERRNGGQNMSDEESIEINNTARPNPRVVKLPNENEVCSICLELLIKNDNGRTYSIIALPCRHWFHKGCANRLLEYHPQCPVCRVRIDSAVLRETPVFIGGSQAGDSSNS
jgi:hypothetical protein